jgi:tetrahydromethanopterin S-methyltransferase subunit G
MMARTTIEAHKRIDKIEPRITKLETEVHIQFKEVFTRIKRLEAILIGAAGTIIAMLVAVLTKMG